jgi:hypothetical protein
MRWTVGIVCVGQLEERNFDRVVKTQPEFSTPWKSEKSLYLNVRENFRLSCKDAN